ncbi:MAG: adenylosuccinate synthase [Flavobacteriaceae bacterium TMED68]|nr:MAG: adenylosuccinate synthase [Flavobacteriaceae bacterium TMED68]|tara:strand:+ start:21066 stop:22337 length:1272 start_codon:yes stop_codon:yes gene_type:complete
MAIDLILGLQWGDEGKGKIVDVLTDNYDIIARFQGGPNAGHTLEFEGKKHVLHTIPSGIFHQGSLNLIGNGVVIDPISLQREIDDLSPYKIDFSKKLLISKKAHLILPTHKILDAASEQAKGKSKIGSTLKGIGPTYMDKTGRNGIRVGDILDKNWKIKYLKLTKKHLNILKSYNPNKEYDLAQDENIFFKSIESLKKMQLIDSEQFLINSKKNGMKILCEGAQGSLLDIDFGTYPFVTSSTTTAAGACIGLGVAPNQIGDIFGIFKAYSTRVGSGPFPTELFNSEGAKMAKVGNEFGSTTGRARRCGWIDLVSLKYSVKINGVNKLMMMKGDVLSGFKRIKICTAYQMNGVEIDYLPYNISTDNLKPIFKEIPGWDEDLTTITKFSNLPKNFVKYISFLENALEVPIEIVSVGPDRKQTIFK